MALDLAQLRKANRMRLPLFKDKHGRLAHKMKDGSDWTTSDWLAALLGELGEYAEVRENFGLCDIENDEFVLESGKELADVQCYLDLLAMRCLDRPGEPHLTGIRLEHRTSTPPWSDPFEALLSHIGKFANEHKKFRRGDRSFAEYEAIARAAFGDIQALLDELAETQGIDLEQAVHCKFNEVSRRINVNVRLDSNGAYKLDG